MKKIAFMMLGLLLVVALVAGSGPVAAAPEAGAGEDTWIVWGRVCVDTDQDGRCDVGERSLSGVTVALLDEDEDEVETYVTGYSGLFQFVLDLEDGDVEDGDTVYIVETDPSGYDSVGPNVLEVEASAGSRTWAGDFCDVPAEIPSPEPMICTLSTRVYIDFRGDGYFQAGVDVPMGNVPVTLNFADGTNVELETTSSGMVYFPGFDAANGVVVGVELPASFRGYALASAPDSPTSIQLHADDFHFDHAFVEFRANVSGEAAGP